jgi:hypothetical protein
MVSMMIHTLHKNKEGVMKNADRLAVIKARMFTRQQTQHHHRELTEHGRTRQRVEDDLYRMEASRRYTRTM